MRNANSLEAASNLYLTKAIEVIDLLEDTMVPIQADEVVLANAYLMLGKTDKAMETLQFRIYENVLHVINELNTYMMLFVMEKDTFEEIKNRMLQITNAFNIEKLNPNMMGSIYYSLATACVQLGQSEVAIDYLYRYVHVCKSFEFPATLQGDEFFNMVDIQFNLFELGTISPRDEKSIKISMVAAVKDNPVFHAIKDQKDFKNIVKQLEELLIQYVTYTDIKKL